MTSILPQPKQASKLVKKTGPGPMIPYTLTKKAAKRKKRPLPANVGGDSDSDGEPVSFFSHLESTIDSSQPPGHNGNSSDSLLDAAPSAPKPFTVGGGGVWEEAAHTNWAGSELGSVSSGEGVATEGVVTDERYEQPVEASGVQGVGSMPGVGPGLSMDDEQAVSY